MLRKVGRSRSFASASASAPQGDQSTGLWACCRRTGLVAPARRLGTTRWYPRSSGPTMAVMSSIAGFLPSTHGLHFANHFAPGPTVRLGPLDPRWIGIGDASAGLCGGMAWYVRERFEGGQPIPSDTHEPANDSP